MNATIGADAIKGLAAKLQGMIELAALLEEIGSLDNAAAEARTRTGQARAAEKQAVADMSVATAARDRATDEAAAILARASDESSKVKDAAVVEAADIVASAEFKADAITTKAADEAKRVTDASAKASDEARVSASQARLDLSMMDARIIDLRAEVEALEGRLATAKAAGAKAIADALAG